MEDFESFKVSREKMDPMSRKMTDPQWQQAYAAYRNTRERVGGGKANHEKKVKIRRRSKHVQSASGGREPYLSASLSELGVLRRVVREQSAYSDLRLIIKILAWVAIAMFALIGVVSMFFYTSVPAALIALIWAVARVLGVVFARLLMLVLIDLADIALFRIKSSDQAGGSEDF